LGAGEGALLVHEDFTGSYRAVLRYVSRRRPGRRVETAPGAQVQVDWVTRAVCVEALRGGAGVVSVWYDGKLLASTPATRLAACWSISSITKGRGMTG